MSIHFSFPPPGHPLPSPSCPLLSLQRWLFCGTLLHAGVYSNLQIDNFPAFDENQEVLYLIGQQGAVETYNLHISNPSVFTNNLPVKVCSPNVCSLFFQLPCGWTLILAQLYCPEPFCLFIVPEKALQDVIWTPVNLHLGSWNVSFFFKFL